MGTEELFIIICLFIIIYNMFLAQNNELRANEVLDEVCIYEGANGWMREIKVHQKERVPIKRNLYHFFLQYLS